MDILEETNQEHEDIRSKIILGIIIYINDLRKMNHQIILLIDTNEGFTSRDYGLAKLTQHTNMTDPIFNRHDNSLEPNTYTRGSQRMDFHFCTPQIEEYIVRCGIIPTDLLTSSDHRSVYLDINILSFLK